MKNKKKVDGDDPSFFSSPLSLRPINPPLPNPPLTPSRTLRSLSESNRSEKAALALHSGGHFQNPGSINRSRGGVFLMPEKKTKKVKKKVKKEKREVQQSFFLVARLTKAITWVSNSFRFF